MTINALQSGKIDYFPLFRNTTIAPMNGTASGKNGAYWQAAEFSSRSSMGPEKTGSLHFREKGLQK